MDFPDWWSPLARMTPRIDPSSPAKRVRFSCRLSDSPPDEWIDFFMDPQVQTEFPPDGLRIEGSTAGFQIMGECAEEALQKCIINIDSRIKSANAKYEQEVIPKIVENSNRETEEREAQSHRIKELQRRADEL